MFIPNKLIISTHLVKNSKLNNIINMNPDFFSEESAADADFNILSLFIFWEKLKGKSSFYAPMFDVSTENHSLLSWSENEVDCLDDFMIKEQFIEFREDMESNWLKIHSIIKLNYDIFQNIEENDNLKEIYFWAYEFTMTRCYGWSLPSTILIPLADFLNHEKHGVDHYLIHKTYEINPLIKHPGYNIKCKNIDLTDFNELSCTLDEDEKVVLEKFTNHREIYIEEYFDFLEKNDQNYFIQNKKNITPNYQRCFINKINFSRIKKDKNRQIYHYNFFETSDEEDNDTGFFQKNAFSFF